MRTFTAQILGVDFDEFQKNKTYYEKQVDLSLGGGNKIETTYDDGKIRVKVQTSDELDDINENTLQELVLDQILKFIVAAFDFQNKVSVESLDM